MEHDVGFMSKVVANQKGHKHKGKITLRKKFHSKHRQHIIAPFQLALGSGIRIT